MPTCRARRRSSARTLQAAEKSFARAVQLNPNNRDYTLALIVTREHRLSELVQLAAKQRLLGKNERAERCSRRRARSTRTTPIIAQHFESASAGSGGLRASDRQLRRGFAGRPRQA